MHKHTGPNHELIYEGPAPCDDCEYFDYCGKNELACREYVCYYNPKLKEVSGPRWPNKQNYNAVFRLCGEVDRGKDGVDRGCRFTLKLINFLYYCPKHDAKLIAELKHVQS